MFFSPLQFLSSSKRLLIKNENFDTRDFTLFIAQKKWVKHILRPLLELCAREDSVLAMNCCSLALILVKKISEKTMKLAEKSARKAKKNKALKNGDEGKSSENPTNGESNNQAMTLDSSDDENKNDGAIGQMRIQNAKDQLQALMSFKEALCSGTLFHSSYRLVSNTGFNGDVVFRIV